MYFLSSYCYLMRMIFCFHIHLVLWLKGYRLVIILKNDSFFLVLECFTALVIR
jgi:hypothetical protein